MFTSSKKSFYDYKKQKGNPPDDCNNCAGLCPNCNLGLNRPCNCKKDKKEFIVNYNRNYLEPLSNDKMPLTINTKKIYPPDQYKCDDFMNKLLGYRYVYIISYPYTKTLSFDYFGNKSFVYVDKKYPKGNDMTDNLNKNLQKWQLKIVGVTNPNICLVTINSYTTGKPNYYLSASPSGKVHASLFGGSKNQIWEIESRGGDKYLIKSHLYCTYLAATNEGYLKKNAGIVYLTNKTNKVGLELVWNFQGFGKDIERAMKISKYRPTRAVTDFPYLDDNTGPTEGVVPPGIRLSPDAQKNWPGRNVWMPEFVKVWNNTFTYLPDLQKNVPKLVGKFPITADPKYSEKDQYDIVSEKVKLPLNLRINLKQNENYLDTSGTATIDKLYSQKQTLPLPNGGFARQITGNYPEPAPLKTNYNTVQYSKKPYTFKVKTYGANILQGSDGVNSIYIEMLKKVGGEIKVRATLIVGDSITTNVYTLR